MLGKSVKAKYHAKLNTIQSIASHQCECSATLGLVGFNAIIIFPHCKNLKQKAKEILKGGSLLTSLSF